MNKGMDTIKLWILQIKFFIVDAFGWFRSLLIYLFRPIRFPAAFYGYQNYDWAVRYAEKRANNWPPNWDQMGKQQAVLPLSELSLLVASRLEIELYRKKGLVRKDIKPRKLVKKSYYTTAL